MKRKGIIGLVIVFGFLLLIFLTYKPILNGMGRYLVYPNEKAPSDYIVLLGGETDGQRTRKAVELYRAGLAPKIIVSSGARISWRTTESKEMVALLKELRIPDKDIILEEKSLSTYDNALYTRKLLEKASVQHKRVTIVTDDWHTRRSIYIFRKVFEGSGIHIGSVGSRSLKEIRLEDWWQDHESTQTILNEWSRFIVYLLKY